MSAVPCATRDLRFLRVVVCAAEVGPYKSFACEPTSEGIYEP
jgi:hypothetical protein